VNPADDVIEDCSTGQAFVYLFKRTLTTQVSFGIATIVCAMFQLDLIGQ